jgi:nitronate monooxygenase
MAETMWPDRRLIDLLGIEHPIVLSPMATIGTVGLAASVCAAGGLGSIACAGLAPEAVANVVRELRGLTARPVNVNFFCHVPAKADPASEQAWRERLSVYYRELGLDCDMPFPHRDLAPFDAAMCDVIEDVRPSAISFHFGLPDAKLLTRVKAAGCRVMSSATTVEEARWLEARGVDVVIAQGCEAGGHRATFLAPDIDEAMASQSGTFALVPQVADAVSVPVIAAGGIADGRSVAAAFALGAVGVQLGTAYLLCPEAATPSLHRDALRKGWPDATVLSNVITGRPARLLANRLVREVGPIAAATPAFPSAMDAIAPLRAAAEPRGNTDFTPFWAGEASPLGRELSAERLTASLVKEAGERFRQLCR